MSDHPRCLICSFAVDSFSENAKEDRFEVRCYRCGFYMISQSDAVSLPKYFTDERKNANLSAWVREHEPATVRYNEFEKLTHLRAPTVGERATKLLLYFKELLPEIGTTFSSNLAHSNIIALQDPNFPQVKGFKRGQAQISVCMLSVSWSSNWNELEYLIRNYLWLEKEYVDISGNNNVMLTPKGWARIDQLAQQRMDSQVAFIAMKFDNDLVEFSRQWFEKGIEEAGYEPKALYDHQHNNIIDDEMIALIRQSKFVVCDLTGMSLGAYYEAGYAHGSNADVIFLCEKDYFEEHREDIHFDVNHRPILRWERDEGEDLARKLQKRIEATIGRGPYIPSE
ncbi:MAG: hypothetical protein V3T99_05820 [Nitrososphaerales archaeon]